MGASDSKLVFKQGIFRLSEKRIAADDAYWASFWELPESAEDVFSLFTAADIRRIRDVSRENLETLVLAVCHRLYYLRHSRRFPTAETLLERDALNCIRVLTRLLPYIYEAEHLEQWEENFFWETIHQRPRKQPSIRQEVLFDGHVQDQTPQPHGNTIQEDPGRPLGEELIDTLIDLLFYAGFTIPPNSNDNDNGDKVRLAIWQSGVGCNNPVGSTKELESNRMEILRLLLTLTSKSMYTSASILPVKGIRAISYMTTIQDKTLVLTVLCSLLNTTLKYNPAAWRVPYDHVVFKEPKQVFVTYCLQLLLVLVLYPVPELDTGTPPKNSFRHFLGKLHRPQDFQFVVDGMTRILSQPLQATNSLLPGSQKSLAWAPEMIMMFWEVLQCNKRFRSFIIDTDRAHDLVVLVLFYAIEYKNDASKQGIVRMCVFVLQTLSVEPSFGARLNKAFPGQDTLPQIMRIPNFHGTNSDFLIMSIHSLITSTSKSKLEAIYPALLAIINNIAPHVTDLSAAASSKLIQLFAIMSAPDFLVTNESNHELLQSLLEAINAILENQYAKNAYLVFAILRSQKRFFALRDLIIGGGESALERLAHLRKEAAATAEPSTILARDTSFEDMRRPNGRPPTTAPAPAADPNEAFTIGDDEDEDEDEPTATPVRSSSQSQQTSRAGSISGSVEDAVPAQRGMSEKARGKLPAGSPAFRRHGSTASLGSISLAMGPPGSRFEPSSEWMQSWLPGLPVQTSLTIIEQLVPHLPPQIASSTSSQSLTVIRRTEITGLEAAPVRVQIFEWSPLSLGWYESLLWGLIFSSEMAMFKGAPSVWKGTNVRLFRVQETAAQGPSLMAPRGAVDAVGSNLVQRIGSLNFGGAAAPALQRNNSGGVIRDV
ncbi:hypothetical protein FH972_024477 [Carpinus fangiana]|uniref:Dymeclin n=1 Tax=Carpinus fangiana TaxID=176857 RepID=A0A5N6KYM9_9ROSI|nr:hypothetical protein FH972_024477 [Carpinus fangiana]